MNGPWRLRGYSVGQLLGSGACGEVRRACVSATGEQVALKRIPAASPEQLRRAEREAALLTALDHPHLIRLHALEEADDHVVLVLDLADGGSVAQLLAVRGRLAPGEVITAVAPVAAALAYLHGEGVVHGDVSAANILFTDGGVPLLADVGVARITGDDSDALSTPAYVDPSVAAGCVPGAQSDVFMLAGVALHALTGQPPWAGASAQATLELAARGELGEVGERLAAAGVPPAMARVLRRALDLDPHRRGTAADLALDLRHSGEPIAVELAAGRERFAPQPVAQPGPRHAAVVPGRAAPPPGAASGAGAAVIDRSRPAFERPGSTAVSAPVAGAPPPTRLVGVRPRPVIPRPRTGRARRLRSRVLVLALAAVLAALVGAAGTVWASSRHPSSRASGARAKAQSAAPPTVRPAPAAGTLPPRTMSRAAAPAGPSSSAAAAAPDWAQVLAGLDAIRARAFATRDPELLTRVYVDGPMLRADAAALTRIVPVGCRLIGVRTSYRAVSATSIAARVVVTAIATLPPSRLDCDDGHRGSAPGAGPTRLRVELVHTADGQRIAALAQG